MCQKVSKCRILIVDDVAEVSLPLQIALELEGYTVDVACNGEAALTQVSTNSPDLVLLDVNMPDLNGYEVIQEIRGNPNLPFIPILLMTGHSQSAVALGDNWGANGWIFKPFKMEDLLAQIQEFSC